MQVDLRIPSSKPVAEIVDFARRCEDAGFSGLGFVDSHTFLRDVYVVMAQVLQNTERIRVRPAVTCPGPRHTSVIASVAKTVQELGPGRFELWLGRGGSANFLIGLSGLRLAEMRKAKLEINPRSGQTVAKTVASFFRVNPSLTAKQKKIILPGK